MIAANNKVNIEDLDQSFKEKIHVIEKSLGRELLVTSGYRSPSHPIEAAKKAPGEHTKGLAIDVACGPSPSDFLDVVRAALKHGIERIGISRKSGFVHIGFDNTRPKSIWVY